MEQDSFDSLDDQMDHQDGLVISTNNMRLGSEDGSGNEASGTGSGGSGQRRNQGDELPKSVIVTNVGLQVFDDDETKVRD
jgi:hypothetical protein